MSYADADGLRIAYDDQGPRADAAVLCLTGWWMDRGFYAPLAERLAARRRVITLDWRVQVSSRCYPHRGASSGQWLGAAADESVTVRPGSLAVVVARPAIESVYA